MKKIRISDVTMKRKGGADGFGLSFREKLELAKLLDRLGVSVIEADPIANKKTDSLLLKSLSTAIRSGVLAVPVSLTEDDSASATWNAISQAVHPRMQVCAPVSTVQMEYFLGKKPAVILEMLKQRVAQCRELCADVEFVAEDAGRSEWDFLKKAIAAAVEAGATVVTVCDTAGTMLPDEFFDAVASVRKIVPETVSLGVSCSNAMYMADACAVAAIRAGADEVKAAACGESTASVEKLVEILRHRGDGFDVSCGIRTTELQRVIGQIRWMCETVRSKASPFDSGVRQESQEMFLNIHDDITAVTQAVERMGYDLSEDDAERVYEAFTTIASRKEQVGIRELDAIVASAAMQVPAAYTLKSFVINSGNIITATAHMQLEKDGQVLEGICIGDGPIDASFLAIEQIIGCHYELDDFQIQAVTEGREAMGETVVRLRSQGKLYSGRGISTDIVGSSIQAYISAVNKIVYEEAGV